MFTFRPILILACAVVTLAAQAPVDLNSLAVAAKGFASHGMQGQPHQPSLELCLMRGDNGGDPSQLMSRASDVQRWTVFYQASYRKLAEDAETEGIASLPRSASLKCTRGLFSDFQLAKAPVSGVKSMEFTWMAVSLDAAIGHLNAYGYVRGFSKVETKRPDLPGYPDELVYIFTCPWERNRVAISANTGAMAWYQAF